jgi:hypothetical protein
VCSKKVYLAWRTSGKANALLSGREDGNHSPRRDISSLDQRDTCRTRPTPQHLLSLVAALPGNGSRWPV